MNKKTILITGGNGENGIGLGVGKRFAAEGWRVIILDIAKQPTVACSEVVNSSDGKYYSCDVSNKAQVDSVMKEVYDTFEFIDVLHSNAGILQWHPFIEYTEEEISQELDINLKGMFFVTQPIARKMIDAKKGCIVLTGSMGGKESAANQSVYAASKGGVIQLAKTLSKELGPYGVRVNSICPGIIDTDMCIGCPEPSVPWITKTPLNRFGTPVDVAGVVWFLASKDAQYITGQAVNITGGMMTF
ncbi:MAG: SDR family NAD(P)-dependent oxidoreductase [Lachnospiraceae bacterium]